LLGVHVHNCPTDVEGMVNMLLSAEEEVLARNNCDYGYAGLDLPQMHMRMNGF
jgi:hypothetical protein